MYESFYGLSERPFNLTPDPRYLFLSDKHKEAFAHLLFGIKNRCGFVMVTGEIGTGKTTICRTLLNQLDDDTEVAFIFNPRLSPEDLLRTINEDFGIASKGATAKELIDELNAYLLERNAQGKNCVLVIDESQNLAPPVLEQIRLLSNLETETQKLLQIVLIGQPELAQNLALPELRQLNQRITARYHLKPLDRKETAQYITHRLHTAGGHKKVRFARGAVSKVYRFSGGTPRVINAVCDRALLVGFTREVRDISKAIVAKAAREVRGERVRMKKTPKPADTQPFPWKMVAAAAMIMLMAGALLYGPALLQQTSWAPGIFALNSESTNPDRRVDIARAATGTNLDETPARALDTTTGLENGGNFDILLEEAPDPTPFQLAVGRLEPNLPRNAAAQALLRAWRMAMVGEYPANDTLDALRSFAAQNGFEHEAFFISLDQLQRINLPAFVRMTTDRHPVWVALMGIEEDRVRVTTTMGQTIDIDQDEFAKRYLGESLLIWRDPRPNDPVLMAGARGDSVRALQRALQEAGHYDGPITGVYDGATEAAVNAVQAATGVTVDGKVGPHTRMAMTTWLADGTVPQLTPRGAVEVASIPAPASASPVAAEVESAESPAPDDVIETAAVSEAEPETPAHDAAPEEEAPIAVASQEDGAAQDDEDAQEDGRTADELNLLALFERPEQSPLPDPSEAPGSSNSQPEAIDPLADDAAPGAANGGASASLLASIKENAGSEAGDGGEALGAMFDALRAAIADNDVDTVAAINAARGNGEGAPEEAGAPAEESSQ